MPQRYIATVRMTRPDRVRPYQGWVSSHTASASAAWVAFAGLAAAGCSRPWCRPRWPSPRRASRARGSSPARSPRRGAGGASTPCSRCCPSGSRPSSWWHCRRRSASTRLRGTGRPSPHSVDCSGSVPSSRADSSRSSCSRRSGPCGAGSPCRRRTRRGGCARARIGLFGVAGLAGALGAGRRAGGPGHRPCARPAHPLVGGPRATAVVAEAPVRRNRGSRLRGPGRAREQPARARHRVSGPRQQRPRRLHGGRPW